MTHALLRISIPLSWALVPALLLGAAEPALPWPPAGATAAHAAPKGLAAALQGDDLAFFRRTGGQADRWPMGEASASARDALEAAALWGSPRVFQHLLDRRGARNLDLEAQGRLLHMAIATLPREVPLVPSPKGDPEARARAWFEAVSRATARKERILRLLLRSGLSPELPDGDGLRPLHQAALHANLPALRRLLTTRPALDEPAPPAPPGDPSRSHQAFLALTAGRTPLELAILGRTALAGDDPSSEGMPGCSPEAQAEAILLLLRKGADLRHRDAQGRTPLLLACRHLCNRDLAEPGRPEDHRLGNPGRALHVLQQMLKGGADPRAIAPPAETALTAAARSDFAEAVPLLESLIPRSLQNPAAHEGQPTFDPWQEALLEALAARSHRAIRILLPGCRHPFEPGLFLDPQGRRPTPVALASRISVSLVEQLVQSEQVPARIQEARNLELAGLLGSPGHLDRPRLQEVLGAVLDKGARPDAQAGFTWALAGQVVAEDGPQGDALLGRMLRLEGPPLDSGALASLVDTALALPAPRGLEVLTLVHDKAGSLSALDPSELFRKAGRARDGRIYARLVSWLGPLDESTRTGAFLEAVAEVDLPAMRAWIAAGLSPYARDARTGSTALETAWQAREGRAFVDLMALIQEAGMVQRDLLRRFLDRHLASGDLGPAPEAARKLDALAQAGITLASFPRHPLWSRGRDASGPGLFPVDRQAAEVLLELARRGMPLNRSFEGRPFLATYLSADRDAPRHPDLVRELLRQGASREQLLRGATLLHRMAQAGDEEVAQVLLEAGLPVDSTRAPFGATPLMWAVEAGRPSMVAWLLDHGADSRRRSSRGHSALDLARKRPRGEILAILERAEDEAPRPRAGHKG